MFQFLAKQRLPARQPNLLNPQGRQNPGHSLNLLKCQNLTSRYPGPPDRFDRLRMTGAHTPPSLVKIPMARSMAMVTGCRPPRVSPRPGRVTSTFSAISLASSACDSSSLRRATMAWLSASRVALTACPKALRCSGSIEPSDFSWAVTSPFLPR